MQYYVVYCKRRKHGVLSHAAALDFSGCTSVYEPYYVHPIFKNPVRRMFTYVGCIEGYIQYYVMYSKGREGGSLRPAADSLF